jgi:osmoprotectant transport system ATP-binding protein
VAEGEVVVLVGPSGCGKTTTLKMINRLIELTDGRIDVDGEDITGVDPVQLRRRIGYMFQGIGLFPHLTVRQNVATVPRLLGWEDAEIAERVDELLELMNLEPARFRDRLPRELSGGQRQRVALARALAAKAKIMLMDEPFGAIDPLNRDILQEEFLKIHRQLGLTTVMVTHDMTEALLMAERIAVMNAGRLEQVDAPRRLMKQPASDYVERIIATPKKQADRLEELARGEDSREPPRAEENLP